MLANSVFFAALDEAHQENTSLLKFYLIRLIAT
jgi:hypothetical protein